MSEYLLLFAASFGAATILPMSSEVLLVAQTISGLDPQVLWLVATCGNTLGAVLNWILAWHFLHYADRPWFPIDAKNLERGQRWFQKFGLWTLLFSWTPLIGDALTFAAGIMRVRFWVFLPLVAVGKGGRYFFVIAASTPT